MTDKPTMLKHEGEWTDFQSYVVAELSDHELRLSRIEEQVKSWDFDLPTLGQLPEERENRRHGVEERTIKGSALNIRNYEDCWFRHLNANPKLVIAGNREAIIGVGKIEEENEQLKARIAELEPPMPEQVRESKELDLTAYYMLNAERDHVKRLEEQVSCLSLDKATLEMQVEQLKVQVPRERLKVKLVCYTISGVYVAEVALEVVSHRISPRCQTEAGVRRWCADHGLEVVE